MPQQAVLPPPRSRRARLSVRPSYPHLDAEYLFAFRHEPCLMFGDDVAFEGLCGEVAADFLHRPAALFKALQGIFEERLVISLLPQLPSLCKHSLIYTQKARVGEALGRVAELGERVGKVEVDALYAPLPYVSGQNLATFTKYSGYNPEVNARPDNALTPGEDYGTYPLARTFMFGINVTL